MTVFAAKIANTYPITLPGIPPDISASNQTLHYPVTMAIYDPLTERDGFVKINIAIPPLNEIRGFLAIFL